MTWEWEADRRENPPPTDRPYCKRLPLLDTKLSLSGEMRRYLEGRGLDYFLAAKNMWYPSTDAGDASPRIVMPGTSHIYGNVYWQARAMDDNPKRYQSPYAPRGDAVIVVWPRNKRISRSVVVEGPMDALAAAELGALGVALMGATPPDESLLLTATLVRGTICIVVADCDAVEAATRFYTFLLDAKVDTRMAVPAPYKDLAEMPSAERKALLSRV